MKLIIILSLQSPRVEIIFVIHYTCAKSGIANDGDAEAKRKALMIVSRLICKWGRRRGVCDYCMPEDLKETMSQMEWRLFLSNMMKELCSDGNVANLGLTYGDWYMKNKANMCNTINRLINQIVPNFCIKINTLRPARNTANEMIKGESIQRSDGVKIMTIHASKGCTFDAVLLVSSKDKKGKDGYWESWLDVGEEASRICYVACTRPRYLLCWAVGALSNDEQRKKLENIGLVRLE